MSGTATYVQRKIDLTIKLGEGSFGKSNFNTVKLSGLRVAATIQKLGPPGAANADVRVYGVDQSVMNQVSTLGVPLPMARLNTITIEAGDTTNGMATVYVGTINNAWQNLDGSPEVFLNIAGVTGYYDAMAPVPPISFPGGADVATIMSGIATRMGRTFENNGVQVQLSNPYFAGTATEQAQACARAANIEMFDDGSVLAIWPKTGQRGGVIPLISPASGMVGYPQYTSQGMRFRCLFNPNITFGGTIKMESMITPANGDWYVNELTYNLSAQLPGGPWFCEVGCVRQQGAPKAP